MAYIETLVEAYIESKHGWAVAEQFRDTFDGESFEEQNINALHHIRGSVNIILDSDLLNEATQSELQRYANELEEYIVGQSK